MERLIVDGYNIIFAWPELSAVKDVKLEDARDLLISVLADYAAMTRQKVTVVFDSHRRPDAEASTQTINGVQVVYSGRKTSADHVIERLLFEAKASDEVTVATSDAVQRDLALEHRREELRLTRRAGRRSGESDDDFTDRLEKLEQDTARLEEQVEDLDPRTRERLDQMRRGELPPK